jgi:hypothetical protein
MLAGVPHDLFHHKQVIRIQFIVYCRPIPTHIGHVSCMLNGQFILKSSVTQLSAKFLLRNVNQCDWQKE